MRININTSQAIIWYYKPAEIVRVILQCRAYTIECINAQTFGKAETILVVV